MRLGHKLIEWIDVQSYLLLKNGIKPVIRTGINNDVMFGYIRNLCQREGFSLKTGTLEMFGNKWRVGYISRKSELAEKACELERDNNIMEYGRLLGYPDCCIKNWMARIHRGDDMVIESFIKTKPSFYCNNIFNFESRIDPHREIGQGSGKIFDKSCHNFLIRHIPCSFDCKESIEIGKKTLELLEMNVPDFAKGVVNVIKKPVLYFDSFRWVVFDGTARGNRLFYKGIASVDSLIEKSLLDKLSKGNELEVTDKHINIIMSGDLLFKMVKKDRYNGVLIGFE
jgi:hypothetical protein